MLGFKGREWTQKLMLKKIFWTSFKVYNNYMKRKNNKTILN